MKSKDYIKKVKEAGIKDDDEIWYIDFAFDDNIEPRKDEKLGWIIS